MNCFKNLVLVLLFAFFSSCTLKPKVLDNMEIHTSTEYKYNIYYHLDSCVTSINKDGYVETFKIIDRNGNYVVEVIAIKAADEKRFKFDVLPTIDATFYNGLDKQISENRDFFTDRIERTYEINNAITLKSTSIYGNDIMYVIYSKYNDSGAQQALDIVDSFKSSSGIGPINFLKRKVYSIIGDNFFSAFLNYVIFSLALTILFIYGVYKCLAISDKMGYVGNIIALVLFLIIFGYVAVTDEFMGYIYGHNNIFVLICSYLLLFLEG